MASIATLASIASITYVQGSYYQTGGRQRPTFFFPPASDATKGNLAAYVLGVGASQANVWKTITLSLAAAVPQNIDFSGSLKDGLGQTITLSKIRELRLWNRSSDAGKTVTVTGNVLAAFGTITNFLLGPSAIIRLRSAIDGYVITGGTQDTMTVTATDALTVEVAVLGVQ
jgi:hypothetical protein